VFNHFELLQILLKHTLSKDLIKIIVVCKSLIQFSNFSEFDGKNTQISLKFDANRANI